MKTDSRELTFFFPGLAEQITTDILDIESLSNNLVVAPAIGNLVTYFSDERPVPYLAKSWSRDGATWTFELKDGFQCEDGELINAVNFARSLARSIRLYSQGIDHPIFSHLKGYRELLTSGGNEFAGIKAVDNKLVFEFEKPVLSGFLEHLTMSPFGFICSANYDGDKWKDPKKIVSSGPFKLEAGGSLSRFRLQRRNNWPTEFPSEFESVVVRRDGIEAFKTHIGSKFIELRSPTDRDLNEYAHIRQLPQTLIVLKAHAKSGVFGNRELRHAFFSTFRKHLDQLSFDSNSYFKTDRFFFNDNTIVKEYTRSIPSLKTEGSHHIKMKVMMREEGSPNNLSKELAAKTAKELGWTIEFNSEPFESFREEYQSTKYDLFVEAAEIGGGFESWVIDMLFCSDIGNRWPDPSGRICELAKKVNEGTVSRESAGQNLQDYLIEDAALMPMFHRGGYYLMGEDIDVKSLGPIVTRIRFEEVKTQK